MPSTAEQIIAAVLLVGGSLTWFVLLRRRSRGEPLIAYEPRRPVPWDASALGMILLVFLGARYLAVEASQRYLLRDPDWQIRLTEAPYRADYWANADYATVMLQANAASQAATALIVALLLKAYYRANRTDLGFAAHRLGDDVRLGLVAFPAFCAPAVLLQGVLEKWIAPSKHAIILALQESPEWRTIAWAGVAAVVVAPMAEEFLFRGVLQGLLERLTTPPGETALPNVVAPPGDLAAAPRTPAEPTSFAPIVASAAIFSLMHWSSGVDVVPLFFLALGLGYMYRQTHRLWHCIVAHMLLNAFSLTMVIRPW